MELENIMRIDRLAFHAERWRDPTIDGAAIPPHSHRALVLWIEEGQMGGGFIAAVLSNDLRLSCERADNENLHALTRIVRWIYNYAPSPCWGSPEAVAAWASHDGMRGLALKALR